MSAALGLSKLRGKECQCHGKKKRNDTPGHIGSQSLADGYFDATPGCPADLSASGSISAGAFSGGHASRASSSRRVTFRAAAFRIQRHFSAFKVISAPQQAQYAAIGPSKRSSLFDAIASAKDSRSSGRRGPSKGNKSIGLLGKVLNIGVRGQAPRQPPYHAAPEPGRGCSSLRQWSRESAGGRPQSTERTDG